MELNKKITPAYFFLSIGIIITVIANIIALLNLSFETLNNTFPDALERGYGFYQSYRYEGMKSALAVLIIIFPLFLALNHFWLKFSQKNKLSAWDDITRRWTLYIILFLTSATIAVDLVVLVRYFVSGEITTRFVLKVLLTLVVSVIVGWYYIRRLRFKDNNIWFAISSSILVLSIIVWSFSVIGSPSKQRKLRLDERRTGDLQSIQYKLIDYWNQKKSLPEELGSLSNSLDNFVIPRDPDPSRSYEYEKLSDRQFQLCATYDLEIEENHYQYPENSIVILNEESEKSYEHIRENNWIHSQGRVCHSRMIEIDPLQ